jgi:hypothetical protein
MAKFVGVMRWQWSASLILVLLHSCLLGDVMLREGYLVVCSNPPSQIGQPINVTACNALYMSRKI